ncbi:MAG: hypothetical protein J7L44_00945 [Candidatus Diapherotrites archaeon]|nr:hypothetical protein [Candidatus Diapherotrites archaeon]
MRNTKKARVLNNKGVQAVITTFLLIVLIVSIVILLIYFNYQGVLQESRLSEEWYSMHEFTTIRNRIDNCLKVFERNDMPSTLAALDKCIPPQAKGYAIERLAYFDCNYGYFTAGDVSDCGNRLIFYMNIPQDKTKYCLARLIVCTR